MRAIPNFTEISDLIYTIQKCMIKIREKSRNMENKSHVDFLAQLAVMTDSHSQNKEAFNKMKKLEQKKIEETLELKREAILDMANALKSNLCNPLIKPLSLKNRLVFFKELILFIWESGENCHNLRIEMMYRLASKIKEHY